MYKLLIYSNIISLAQPEGKLWQSADHAVPVQATLDSLPVEQVRILFREVLFNTSIRQLLCRLIQSLRLRQISKVQVPLQRLNFDLYLIKQRKKGFF